MQQKISKLSMFSLLLYNLTGGRINRSKRDGAVGIPLLRTTGRKTGKKRSSSLVYIRYGSSYVVSASNAGHDQHPGWYFNLRSNPHVEVHIKDQQFKAVAEVASPALRDQLWKHLLEAAPFFSGYQRQTRRVIPIVLFHAEEGESKSGEWCGKVRTTIVGKVVNAVPSEQVWPSDISTCANYPKGLPFPTKRLATQEK